jgi:hypothetical protein
MLDDEKKKKKHTDNYTHMNTQVIDKMKKGNREIEQIQYTHIYERREKKRMSRLYFIRFLMCFLNTQSYKKQTKYVLQTKQRLIINKHHKNLFNMNKRYDEI